MAGSIELTGIEELLNNLKRMGKNVDDVAPRALRAGAEPIRQAASNLAPYDPTHAGPHLKDNIIVSDVQKDGSGELYVEVGPQRGDNNHFFYGKFHEFGTTKMKATPFVEPAFIAKRGECLDNIAAVVREVIERGV